VIHEQGERQPAEDSSVSFEDEIAKAIGAHGMWKNRLRAAIDNGKADANPADVAKDNFCPFGQWLYGSAIPATAKASADYASVRKHDADFHKCAARVLEFVSTGQKAQANMLMAGEYTKISADLTAAMMKWKTARPKLKGCGSSLAPLSYRQRPGRLTSCRVANFARSCVGNPTARRVHSNDARAGIKPCGTHAKAGSI
jgi:methyl-accepting chemotaxis protein